MRVSEPVPLNVPKLPPVGVPEPIDILPLLAIVPLFVMPSAIVTGLVEDALFVNVLPLSTVNVSCEIEAVFEILPLITKSPAPVIVLALVPPVNVNLPAFVTAAVISLAEVVKSPVVATSTVF